jgi:hypothetical protein
MIMRLIDPDASSHGQWWRVEHHTMRYLANPGARKPSGWPEFPDVRIGTVRRCRPPGWRVFLPFLVDVNLSDAAAYREVSRFTAPTEFCSMRPKWWGMPV